MPKILIVDDEWLTRLEIEKMLTDLGYDVAGQAETGAEAVAMARELNPDLILMDVKMPGEMNGIDAAREIKRELGTPIVFISGYGDPEYIEAAKEVAPFGYVMKPFDEREVHAFIEIALSRKKLELKLEESHERLEQTNLDLRKEITARKNTEMALRESEEKYRSLFEQSRDALAITTSHGKVIDANSASMELLGYTKKEILELDFQKLYVDPDDGYRLLKEMKEKGSVKNFEAKMRGKDHVEMDCILDLVCRRGNDGKILQYQGLIRDISEAKRAQEALKASQERLSQIIRFLPDATFVIDLEGKVIAWNRAIEAMTGVKAEEILGKGDYEYAIPFYGERRPILIDLACKPNKEIEEKYQYVKKEGKSLVSETYDPINKPGGFLWNKASLLYDHNGEVIGAIESIRDITDMKTTEEALRESEEKYRSLITNIPDVTWTADYEGKTIFISPNAENVFGYTPEEICEGGNNVFSERIHPEDDGRVKESFEKLFEYGTPFDVEYRIKRKDGEWIWAHDRSTAAYERDGVKYADGIFSNITNRKQAEEALQRRTHDLGERVKELNCLYGISSLIEKPDISLYEIIQGVVDLIPSSWQYPEITSARILLEDKEYKTENFKETNWKQSSDIVAHGKRKGVLEICYLEQKPEIDEGPFVKEERYLINAITERLGRIIDRKWVERALRESEIKLSTLLNATTDVAALAEADGTFTACNDALAKSLGKKKEELIGKPMMEFLSAEVAERRKTLLQGMVASKKPSRWEDEHAGRYFDNSVYPILDDNGNVKQIALFARNITDQKKAEELLKEKQQMNDLLLNSMPYPIMLINKARVLMAANKIALDTGVKIGDYCWKSFGKCEYLSDKDQICAGENPDAPGIQCTFCRADEMFKTNGPANDPEVSAFGRLWDAYWIPLNDNQYLHYNIDVTDQKQAEAESVLRESEKKYRTLVESNPYGFQDIDSTGIITYTNATFRQMTGYTQEELSGKSILNLIEPASKRDELSEYLSMLVKEQPEPTIYSQQYRTKDGRVIDIEVSWRYNRDNKGGVVGFSSIITDVTERKQAEVVVRESEEKHRALIENLTDLILILDEDGINVWNSPAVRQYGIGPEDVVGRSCFEYVHPDDLEKTRKIWGKIIANPGKKFIFGNRATGTPENPETWIYQHNIAVYLPEVPGINGVVAVCRNVTEQKLAENALLDLNEQLVERTTELELNTLSLERQRELVGKKNIGLEEAWKALRESEEQYRTLLNNLPVGVYRNTPGPEGRFLMANPAFCKMVAYEQRGRSQKDTAC